MAITPPEVSPKRELARKLFDAVISEIPFIGGPYAAMLSVTHPSKIDELQKKWQKDVSEALNKIDDIVDEIVPTVTLSDEAIQIGVWGSKNSEDGRTDGIDFSKIVAAFPDMKKLAVEDACGELELAGLVSLSGAIGHKIMRVRPSHEFFEVFDPIALDEGNPREDAANIARYAVHNDKTISAEEIIGHFGWNARRYNPAIGIVTDMISKGRKSAELHPHYACRYIMPDSKERAALKQFANKVLGPEN